MIEKSERDEIVGEAVEAVLRLLPNIITHLISQASVMHTLKTKFYEDNKDLVEHKDIVAQVIEQLEVSSPGEKLENLISKVGPETRRRLKEVQSFRSQGRLSLKELDSNLNGIL